MPINGPSASAPYSYLVAPEGPASPTIDAEQIDAEQNLSPHDTMVQAVDLYIGPISEPRHGMAVTRLLAVCACDLQAASVTESHLDAILFNILERPPFHEIPTEKIRSLVEFLKGGPYPQTPDSARYAWGNQEEIARIVLEHDNRYYQVNEFLREVRGDTDHSRESGLNLIHASYEYSLTAAVLLADPEQRDDTAAKVELYRRMAGRIPAALIARSIDDPETTQQSGKHLNASVKQHIHVWSVLQCDLALAAAIPPKDLRLDIPPSVVCFIERYFHALDRVCRHIEFAMGNANYLASRSHMTACSNMVDRVVSSQLTLTVLGPSIQALETHKVPVPVEPMRSMITQLHTHKREIAKLFGELMAPEFAQVLEPRTWSGVSELELAVAHWRTDDYVPEKWRNDLLEPGAQEFARTLVELAKIPTERFGSLISPVFETLRKLIDNPKLRRHAFKEAKAAFSPDQPVRTWILIRQCINAYEIGEGSYDIQTDTGGYGSRIRRPLMDIVSEDFRNYEKEICDLDRKISKNEARADKREKELDECRDPSLHTAFLAYAWRNSTLFPAFVLRMHQQKLSDDQVNRGLLYHGMSETQIQASRAEKRIPVRLGQGAPQWSTMGPPRTVPPARRVAPVPSPLAFPAHRAEPVPPLPAFPAHRAAPLPSPLAQQAHPAHLVRQLAPMPISNAHSSQSSTVTEPPAVAAHRRPPRKRPRPAQQNSQG